MATDLEKRLRLLRQQVYGRETIPTSISRTSAKETTDITYLYQDLVKIGILASSAIGIQIIIFILKLF